MADTKDSRDKQADREDQRQRERDIIQELERWDETEPSVESAELETIEMELTSLEFPAAGSEVVAEIGDREIKSADGSYTIDELISDTDEETFDAPATIRLRVQRPTVAAAMKRVVEATVMYQNTVLRGSQRKAYEKTLRELKAIDADDDDEGIQVITDWIIEQIRDKEKLPGSRAVRRQAAKFCRANGYQIRNDEWLGI